MNDKISRGLNSTFITLVPKKIGVNLIQDFNFISLISAPNKIIAKVLTEVIDGNLYAFIKGRQVLASVLIANECV